MRASDTDREQVNERLCRAYDNGQLSTEDALELEFRAG